ncbi:MAG TPA: hypothetical protein VI197_07695 [Polyangiaceae bacterium]
MKIVCGCCERAPLTPEAVFNRPALSAIRYRVGTYSSFRESMFQSVATQPELSGLSTRQSDDYAITLLESWALVADVLTFYQERYANEAFLRTARFRDSVVRLASLLDYRLRPGVAARAWLAFTLDVGARVSVPLRQKVQSVPEGDALPQVYETLEVVAADARLNRLRVFPAPVADAPLAAGRRSMTLDRLAGPALAAPLAPGHTVVIFDHGFSHGVEEKEIESLTNVDDRVEVVWTRAIDKAVWSASSQVFRFNRRFRLFGHSAPSSTMLPREDLPAHPGRIVWDLRLTDYALSDLTTLELDGTYDKLVVGQKLLVDSAGATRLVTIKAIEQVNAELPVQPATGKPAANALSGAATRVHVAPNHAGGDRRAVTVYELQGDALARWSQSYPNSLSGDQLYIPGIAVDDPELGLGVEVGRSTGRGAFTAGQRLFPVELDPGRRLIVLDADVSREPLVATIKHPPSIEPSTALAGDFCHLVVEIEAERELDQATASAVLLGNVARASQGETVLSEVLGSGSRAARFQRFSLGKTPLTYLPALTPSGTASTLELWADGARWREVPGLFGQPAEAPVYELRHMDDGTTIVQFGDGHMGAQLPTGSGNVRATYRKGSGLAGRVPARSLSLLLGKPPGLAECTNPSPAEGGADAETLDRARENAPRTVRTFGRAVSLQDFEDLVTASGEVAKAHVTWVWDGLDQAIHLTVAGQEGVALSDEARRDLGRGLDTARDRNHRLLIDDFAAVPVRLQAGVGVDPAHDRDQVLAAAHAAVVDALSFEQQRLGQSLHLSDFYATLQGVAGVVFVDIDTFHFKLPPGIPGFIYALSRGASLAPVQPHLRIFSARPLPNTLGQVLPAELAVLEAPAQDVAIVARAV